MTGYKPREVSRVLDEALENMPVVVLSGMRQAVAQKIDNGNGDVDLITKYLLGDPLDEDVWVTLPRAVPFVKEYYDAVLSAHAIISQSA